MTDSKQEILIDYRPHTPTAIAARFSRMSYTDLFALALRYGTGGGPPGLKPSQARQFSLACENQHPLRKNILRERAG